ncbi:hypothetical protein BGW39_000167, partial [Mortierella sp. 14UC]
MQLRKASTALDRVTSARCESVCLLLSSIAQIYPERLKIRLTSSRLAEKICLLFKNDAKHMRLACLDHDAKCFNQMMIRNRVIHGLFAVLQDAADSRNVPSSACLDLFDCIRKKNIKRLVSRCATTHKEMIKEFNYTSVFKSLKALYVSCNDSGAADLDFQAVAVVAARTRDIRRSHRRPFFKADEDRIAKRKRRAEDVSNDDEDTTRMRTRQRRVMEEDTSKDHLKSSVESS